MLYSACSSLEVLSFKLALSCVSNGMHRTPAPRPQSALNGKADAADYVTQAVFEVGALLLARTVSNQTAWGWRHLPQHAAIAAERTWQRGYWLDIPTVAGLTHAGDNQQPGLL